MSSLKDQHSKLKAGLTLIELIIVTAIMITVASMIFGAYKQFNSVEALRVGPTTAASILERARSQSVAGVDGMAHGVHIASTTLTMFEGAVYNAGSASNVSVPLANNLIVSQVQLASGGYDIVFAQLIGTTTGSGTITFQVSGDMSRSRTVSITSTGIVSVQ